jgi:MarC family integral membrane protein
MLRCWSAFLPLFVAVDIVGVLPVYLGFVAAVDERARRRIVVDATLTAAAVCGGFLFLGDAILSVVGVSVGDFQVAGGLLLLILVQATSPVAWSRLRASEPGRPSHREVISLREHHDTQTEVGPLPALFEKGQSEDRKTQEPGYFRYARRGSTA